MAKLTFSQLATLSALSGGEVLCRDNDGNVWVSPSNETVWDDGGDTEDLITRRLIAPFAGFVSGYAITNVGRAALSEANAAPVPPHDLSGVISDPLSSGDSEMQGRLPRGEEFVPDERARTASEVAK